MTTLLDTNIVIALLDPEDHFHAWAAGKLEDLKADGPTVISDMVYCEVSVAMDNSDQMDEAISSLGLDRITCSNEALFRAGKAYLRYKRENKGPKLGVLPDFIIGALADAEDIPLWTTNRQDYVGYYPNLALIVPPDDEADEEAVAAGA